MKLREYIAQLQSLAENQPETLDYDVVYSRDDEGNGFQEVYFGPSVGLFERAEFVSVEGFEESDVEDSPNAVCIN